MTEAREKCTKLFARIVRKNVKFHSNQEKTVRSIARIVSQSTKMAAVNFKTAIAKGDTLKCPLFFFFIFLSISAFPVFAQSQQNANDIILKMQHDLNLSQDQVANITQIIERYVDASNDLQKSIDDGTMNPSAVDSQRQQIKAAEEQGIAQYLRSDQLTEWNQIQGQMDQQKDNGDSDANVDANTDSDQYSNLPRPSGT